MSRSLPPKPSLRFLQEEAKDLLKALRQGDADVCGVFRLLRRYRDLANKDILSADVSLAEAQFVLALDYGFKSWTHLVSLVKSKHAAGRPEVPDAGLVAWYPFNGNASDESGNGHDGRIEGARLTADRFGNRDSAYAFDGAAGIAITDPPSIAPCLTVSAWVRYGVADAPKPFSNFIVHRGRGGPAENYLEMSTFKLKTGPDAGRLTFAWDHHWSDATGSGGGFCRADEAIIPDVWYHVVATFDGERHRLYVDGDIRDSIRGQMPPAGNLITIGCANKRHEQFFFHGVIDDVRIYDRALSRKEIQALFREGDSEKP